MAACSYRSRVIEKHQLSLSSRVRKKNGLSAGSRGVLTAWFLSTRTDAEMHVGHLRHVCSCSLNAAHRLRVVLQTTSHQSGLGLSNETVLLQRRLADSNDEQPSPSLSCHKRGEPEDPDLQRTLLCRLRWNYRHESLRRRATSSGAAWALPLCVSANLPLSHLPKAWNKATRIVPLPGKQTIKASERCAPALTTVMEQDVFFLLNYSGSHLVSTKLFPLSLAVIKQVFFFTESRSLLINTTWKSKCFSSLQYKHLWLF